MARVSPVALLAKRFLLSKASDKFLSFIAWVSVVGVALGVLALTVVTSVINGFEGELAQVITGMNGDVVLYSRGEPIKNPEVIEGKIRRIVPETAAITHSFVTELMVSGPNGVAGAVLEGLDAKTVGEVTVVPKRLISGRLPQAEGEVAVTSSLASRIGAEEGSQLRLIIPFVGEAIGEGDKKDPAAAPPKSVNAKVVGIVKMGLYEYDSKFLFGSLEGVQKFLDQPGKVSTFKLRLKPGSDSKAASDRLTESFGYPFRAKDWAQLNKNLFYAIQLEKVVIAIILTVIVLVAAFNVVSTLMMMIHDKTKEIAILKAMGFRPSQSFRLFCLIGLGMGAVGTVTGIGIGLAITWVLKSTRLITLPAEIYYIGFLPVVVRWTEIGLVALVAMAVAFAATLYPGWKVARKTPLDGLRYD